MVLSHSCDIANVFDVTQQYENLRNRYFIIFGTYASHMDQLEKCSGSAVECKT